MIKICIPVSSNDGLNSEISAHFGRAPFHAFYHLESDWLQIVEKTSCRENEAHGHCLPVELLLEYGVTCVLCRGIGRGAINRLHRHAISVLYTDSGTIAESIRAFRLNQLAVLDASHVCQGHHH